ncbi:hypothetical protein FOL47_009996 [Perkinsus chesapeaki]|uniref:Uncharacterized protein n=1 Tax=Perkinsus chesapeaki TaxID=330153 RepID=A0A7J6L5C3_PERCH|nr:hypothetical protein FOL47_009996 [Perkinsus chesapeaki]
MLVRLQLIVLALSSKLGSGIIEIPIVLDNHLQVAEMEVDGTQQFPVLDTGCPFTMLVPEEWYEKKYYPKTCSSLTTSCYVRPPNAPRRPRKKRTIRFPAEGEITVFDYHGKMKLNGVDVGETKFSLMCDKERPTEPHSLFGLAMRADDSHPPSTIEQLYENRVINDLSFTLYINGFAEETRVRRGMLEIGNPTPLKNHHEVITFVPALKHSHWRVRLNHIDLNGLQIPSEGDIAEFDTGANFMNVPASRWDDTIRQVEEAYGFKLGPEVAEPRLVGEIEPQEPQTRDRRQAILDDKDSLASKISFIRKCLIDEEGDSLIKHQVDSCLADLFKVTSPKSSVQLAEPHHQRVHEFAENMVGRCYLVVKRDLEDKAIIEEKYAQLVASSRNAQKRYLQDVSGMRGQIRGPQADMEGVTMNKGELEVVFYDPVSHLDEELKELVLNICNERLRLMLERPNKTLRDALKALVASQPGALDWMGAEIEEEMAKLKHSCELQVLRISELETEIEKLSEALDATTAELELVKPEIERLQTEKDTITAERDELAERIKALEADKAEALEVVADVQRSLASKEEEFVSLTAEFEKLQEEAQEIGVLQVQLEEERLKREEAFEEFKRQEQEAKEEYRREVEAQQKAFDEQKAQMANVQKEHKRMTLRAEQLAIDLAESNKAVEELGKFKKYKKMYEDERRKAIFLEQELREMTELLNPSDDNGTQKRPRQSALGGTQAKPWMNVFDRLHLDSLDRVSRKRDLAERWYSKLMARVSETLLGLLNGEGSRRLPQRVRGRNHFAMRQQFDGDGDAWKKLLANDSSGDDWSDDDMETAPGSLTSLHLEAGSVDAKKYNVDKMTKRLSQFSKHRRKNRVGKRISGGVDVTQVLRTIMQDPLRVQESQDYQLYSENQSVLLRELAECVVAKLLEPSEQVDPRSHRSPPARCKTPDVPCTLPAIVKPKRRRPCQAAGYTQWPRPDPSSSIDQLDMTCE